MHILHLRKSPESLAKAHKEEIYGNDSKNAVRRLSLSALGRRETLPFRGLNPGARSRSCLCTFGRKVGIMYMLEALGTAYS